MEGSSERRAAVVTGAASGIGRAIAERLEADGLDVLAVNPDSHRRVLAVLALLRSDSYG